MRIIILYIAVFISLPGCIATPPLVIETYEGETKAPDEVGVVTANPESPMFVRFADFAELRGKSELEWKSVRRRFGQYARELHMLPGEYLILTLCSGENKYGVPALTLRVSPGKTYSVECDKALEPGKVQAYVKKLQLQSRKILLASISRNWRNL